MVDKFGKQSNQITIKHSLGKLTQTLQKRMKIDFIREPEM